MSNTVTLAVVDGGEKGCGSKRLVVAGGRRGSCRAWERGEIVELGR